MRRIIGIMLLMATWHMVVLGQDQDRARSDYDALVMAAKKNLTNTEKSNGLVGSKALNQYLYKSFGKVALGNDDFISSGTAFNAAFSKDDASISATYTRPFLIKNPWAMWNISGKGGADDGSLFFLSKGKLNWQFGGELGLTFLGNSNISFFDKKNGKLTKSIEKARQARLDTLHSLFVQYKDLVSDKPEILADSIKLITKLLNDDNRYDFDNVGKVTNGEDLVKIKKGLQERLDRVTDYLEAKSENPGTWAKIRTENDLTACDMGILDKYVSAINLHWFDVKVQIKYEKKHYLDTLDVKDDYQPDKGFMRYSGVLGFNYYHKEDKVLSYIRLEATIGNAYGYDLLTPNNYTLDTGILTKGVSSLNKNGEEIRAFSPYFNPTYDQQYFSFNPSFLVDAYFGEKKKLGFELAGSLNLMKNVKKTDADTKFRAPAEWHVGLLLSPVDKDDKGSEGTIGFLWGMQKMDLGEPKSVNWENWYLAIRVGLPLAGPLTRKK